jgi:hypothetical protein
MQLDKLFLAKEQGKMGITPIQLSTTPVMKG